MKEGQREREKKELPEVLLWAGNALLSLVLRAPLLTAGVSGARRTGSARFQDREPGFEFPLYCCGMVVKGFNTLGTKFSQLKSSNNKLKCMGIQ